MLEASQNDAMEEAMIDGVQEGMTLALARAALSALKRRFKAAQQSASRGILLHLYEKDGLDIADSIRAVDDTLRLFLRRIGICEKVFFVFDSDHASLIDRRLPLHRVLVSSHRPKPLHPVDWALAKALAPGESILFALAGDMHGLLSGHQRLAGKRFLARLDHIEIDHLLERLLPDFEEGQSDPICDVIRVDRHQDHLVVWGFPAGNLGNPRHRFCSLIAREIGAPALPAPRVSTAAAAALRAAKDGYLTLERNPEPHRHQARDDVTAVRGMLVNELRLAGLIHMVPSPYGTPPRPGESYFSALGSAGSISFLYPMIDAT